MRVRLLSVGLLVVLLNLLVGVGAALAQDPPWPP
jgi:hypothetical protein